ncbi:MAG: IS66 family insertion sequence element accessory protein TnpA [Pseudomonadales bacterium]
MPTRQYRSSSEWQALLAAFKTSGQTVSAFCAQQDISSASFYRWRTRLSAEGDSPVPSFIDVSPSAVSLPPAPGTWCIELNIGNGITLRFHRDH